MSLDQRHRFSTLILVSITVALSPFGSTQVRSDDKPRVPNIVFILADDLGYGDLGCYGQKRIKTPNIDRMAAEGTRFRQCYAGCTVCAPSRCCLMTGLHSGHARIRGNALVPLRPDDVTVAEVLKKSGYQTALIGKWGLGEDGSTGVPERKGFDYAFGYLNQVHAHNYYPSFLWENGKKVMLPNVVEKGVATERKEYSHDLFTRKRWTSSAGRNGRSRSFSISPTRFPMPTTRRRTRAWRFRTMRPTRPSHGLKRRRTTQP